MKKLLAMLTTITSLSSITPIVLANAPTSVEIQENKIVNNEINYTQTNNLENLTRNKRENKITDIAELLNINLEVTVPTVAQTESLSCGPAIAESILRSLGLRNFRTPNTPLYSCQERLIGNMGTTNIFTDLVGGTGVQNWTNTINNYIIRNNLNNFRRVCCTFIKFKY